MQQKTDRAVIQSTFAPNTTVETISAGMSAITTSRMIRAVDCALCTWGAGETMNLLAIFLISLIFPSAGRMRRHRRSVRAEVRFVRFYFLGAAAAARARMIPITACLPSRMKSSSGRYDGHENWQQPHSMHEVIICSSSTSQFLRRAIFER